MVVGAGPPGGLQRRRLSFQQPLQSKGSDRLVYSEKELLTALSDFAQNSTGDYIGKTIRLAQPMTISSSIIIPVSLKGLTIDGQNVVLTPTTTIGYIFDVRASEITIKSAVLVVPSNVTVTALIGVPNNLSTVVPTRCTVDDCKTTGSSKLIELPDSTSSSSDAVGWTVRNCSYEPDTVTVSDHQIDMGRGGLFLVSNNRIVQSSNPSSFGIYVDGANGIVSGNRLDSGTILADVNANNCVFSGNAMLGGTIDTGTNAPGFCTVLGNTDATLVTDASDAVGLNT